MKPQPKSIFNIFTLFALAISLLGSAVFVTPAYAAGLIVNSAADTVADDGFCTLREAITNADNDSALYASLGECSAGAGADVITFAGNYTITLVGSQLPTVTTVITINGNGAANSMIQASTCNPVTLPGGCTPADHRVFYINNTGDLTLDNLTVRHGRHISVGGGIYNDGGTLTVTNSTLSGNNSVGYGGGILNDTGTTTVTNSTLSGNNSASNGGGIYNDSGTTTVTNSTLSGNSADEWGGGIFNLGTSNVTNSTLSGNSADSAGGINGWGGGIFNGGGTLTVTNSTLSGNSADSAGGGILNDSTLNITNTIIANSTNGDCLNLGNILTNTNNLVEDNTCSPLLSGAPNLGGLADNGGPTQTFALLTGSPAIDAGTNTGCPAADQRGITRPQGAACDIGAYEAPPPALPDTGFAPNRITSLSTLPANLAYNNLGSIWMEIPSLDVKTEIVGVPQSAEGWNVDWLGSSAGWLHGTAFPSWEGNSVVTAHVYDSNGLPGPFQKIKNLKSGDKVIVHMYGEQYIFEVRDSSMVFPSSTKSALEHLEGHSYLTLITCQWYNPVMDNYAFRRVVRAVLVDVQAE